MTTSRKTTKTVKSATATVRNPVSAEAAAPAEAAGQAEREAAKAKADAVTQRREQVAKLTGEGLTRHQIAARLEVSMYVVRNDQHATGLTAVRPDRADPAGYETDPDEPFCPDHDWPLACTGQRTPSGALIYECPEGETWHRAGTRLYRPGAEAPETLTLTCPRHGEQPVTGCVAFTGYAGGTCYAHQLACGCTDLDESGDVAAAY